MERAQPILTALTAVARAAFGAAACSIALLDESGEELVFAAADGEGAAAIVGTRLAASHGIAGWAVASGQALAIADVAEDPRFSRETAEQTGYVPGTILAAPVIDGADAVGVIEVLDPARGADLDLLGRFADAAGVVVREVLGAAEDGGPAGVDPTEEALREAALAYARQRGR